MLSSCVHEFMIINTEERLLSWTNDALCSTVWHSKTTNALNSVIYCGIKYFHWWHMDTLNNIDRINHCLIHFCSLTLPRICLCISVPYFCFTWLSLADVLHWRRVVIFLINDDYGYWWKKKAKHETVYVDRFT